MDAVASTSRDRAQIVAPGLPLPLGSPCHAVRAGDLVFVGALGAPEDTGIRTALTGDDRWIVLAHPAPPARPSALLATPDGFVACENWQIEVSRA